MFFEWQLSSDRLRSKFSALDEILRQANEMQKANHCNPLSGSEREKNKKRRKKNIFFHT
jgi:hypothetical protein